MTTFTHIFLATPKWVFGLFLLLLWLGGKQLLARRVSLRRTTVLPLAMAALSLCGVLSAFGSVPSALLGWTACAVAAFAAAARAALPATVRYDAGDRSFFVPGSAVPLALMMGIFCTKYAAGAALAMHPALAHDAATATLLGMLYGAFSGSFAGRAARLWRLALRQDRAASALPAAL